MQSTFLPRNNKVLSLELNIRGHVKIPNWPVRKLLWEFQQFTFDLWTKTYLVKWTRFSSNEVSSMMDEFRVAASATRGQRGASRCWAGREEGSEEEITRHVESDVEVFVWTSCERVTFLIFKTRRMSWWILARRHRKPPPANVWVRSLISFVQLH